MGLLFTANVVPNSLFLNDEDDTFLRNVGSYKSPTCHIPEDGILHSARRENLNSTQFYRLIAEVQVSCSGSRVPPFYLSVNTSFIKGIYLMHALAGWWSN
jgi:hypothetical protein